MDKTRNAGLGGRSRLRFLAAIAIAALASPGVLALTASPVSAAVAYCDTFSETTPGAYPCTVPDGVTSLDFVVAGGDGGASSDTGEPELNSVGGHGARITGSLTVTPGEVLDIIVGGDGADGTDAAGGGGGYSSIARGDTPIVVAGAGGGGGFAGGDGGSGTGGQAYDGGGYGGTTGLPGRSAENGWSGGILGSGGGGGESITGWSEDVEPVPTAGYAGNGGFYNSLTESPNGGDAPADTHGGGGGGAFGGAGGLHDVTHNGSGEYSAGAMYGAGGNGGYDGGGGGGGYGGGGGGGGGEDEYGNSLDAGGGGGGGSSTFPSGATIGLSLDGSIVSLEDSAAATTLYVVPDGQTVQYGNDFTDTYTFVISSTADGSSEVDETTLSNYTAPTCGSAYTTSTSVSASPLAISCGGGTNAGTAGSADGVTFDYTATASLTITKATLYVVPGDQVIGLGVPAPGAAFYTYQLFTDASLLNAFAGSVDVPPTCGSTYTDTSTGSLPITCGGGANAGTAGSDADYTFDYTSAASLRVNAAPDLSVTPKLKGAVFAPVINVVDPDGYTLTCSIDGATAVECSTGWKSLPLSKGDHTYSVTATDDFGMSSSATGSFTIKSGKVRIG